MSSPASPDELLEQQVKERGVPRHVGIIMDGNGRWAEERGLVRLEGHREGSSSVREVTRVARRLGVSALTLYAFSSQNWARPAEEVAGLMELLREYLEKERAEILDNNIRLDAIGELDRLPRYVRAPLDRLREDSAGNTGMVLSLALSYGGREELVRAARLLAEAAVRGELKPAAVNEEQLERHLWTNGLPPLDLVIRTSGEQRISNFLLWQAAYSELVFAEEPWPAFRTPAFLACLAEYQRRERRYGQTSAQVRGGVVDPTPS
ncbi:polyprenyl diphosphate synthase [Hyalangium rubrum]|uniref:Isoprenyl transferase n=1 Tax=Hyalangium rubrum TaxID=3103134 RepID=A0ABU5HIS7_9BACT|nr:polyprenyl diphosphate synthase [Hyalangium sp. s54d21]MDY7233062.1 polyprenyl diphosphate synthase [Hyalangium sp. s54d21]